MLKGAANRCGNSVFIDIDNVVVDDADDEEEEREQVPFCGILQGRNSFRFRRDACSRLSKLVSTTSVIGGPFTNWVKD